MLSVDSAWVQCTQIEPTLKSQVMWRAQENLRKTWLPEMIFLLTVWNEEDWFLDLQTCFKKLYPYFQAHRFPDLGFLIMISNSTTPYFSTLQCTESVF